jgi:hypothetical protein
MCEACNQRGSHGELIYRCSRCLGCYYCQHVAEEVDGKWVWHCADSKVRELIFDGRVK